MKLAFALVLLLPLAAQAAIPEATAPINKLDDGLQTAMKTSGSLNFAARYAALAPTIDATYDLTTILHNAVGLRWAGLPADQQASLLTAFRNFTIATYVASFNSNSGTHFVTLPDQRAVGDDVVVETQIVPTSGDPTRIDYQMRKEADGWRVVDVLLEGTISRVAVTRSDFRSLLAPGDASKLIADLKKKTSDLSGGTVQ